MKRAVTSALGILALAAAPAMAADIPVKAPIVAPVMAPVVYSWTGFYIGGNFGYSLGRTNIGYVTPFANVAITHNPDSFIGGGQIGYNWQSGSFVFGFEADIAYRHRNRGSTFFFGSTPTAGAPFGSVAGDNTVFGTEQNWLGTVRGRLGFASGAWLVYGTGGFAYGDVRHAVIETLVAPNQTRFRTVGETQNRNRLDRGCRLRVRLWTVVARRRVPVRRSRDLDAESAGDRQPGHIPGRQHELPRHVARRSRQAQLSVRRRAVGRELLIDPFGRAKRLSSAPPESLFGSGPS